MKHPNFLCRIIVSTTIIFIFQPTNIQALAYPGFINDAISPAQASQAETGVPASVSIAQAILESGWGDHHIGSANNYFGIKCQARQDGTLYFGNIATGCVSVDTQEWDGSKYITVKSNFRIYADITDSFRDHGMFFLENPRYSEAMKYTSDPRQFAVEIQKAGYATSPTYATDLIALMDKYNLYQYDKLIPSPSLVTTSTIFVFDTSSSMEKLDASGVVKLDAAKNAGIKLLAVISAENQAGLSSSHEVAIVEFANSATVNLRLTTDIQAAEDALRALYPAGGTAMPKGLKAALDLYPSNPTNQSFIILLSDGLPNIGLNDEDDESVVRQQILDLSTEAGQRGICIFTVGFGDPSSGSIDETFLQQVAGNSRCGSYHNAQNASELANIYISLRHAATGTTLLEKSGNISQDQVLNIENVQIPDNQAMMLFTLNWPGSQLDAILRDPTGVVVDQNYPGAHIALTDTLASIIIQNPKVGLWNVSARGVDVPGGITTYNAVLSVRANVVPPTPVPVTPTPAPVPTSSGSPLAIVFIVLAAAGMMVYVMTQTQKRVSRQTRSVYVFPAVLVGLNGTFAGCSIPIKDGLLIGRSSACALCLYENIVSRQHARLRYMNGHWYIQDLNSRSGVYVNGVRVNAASLNKGDRIRIGSTEFQFN